MSGYAEYKKGEAMTTKPTPAKTQKSLAEHRRRIGHEIGHYCNECQRIINDKANRKPK